MRSRALNNFCRAEKWEWEKRKEKDVEITFSIVSFESGRRWHQMSEQRHLSLCCNHRKVCDCCGTAELVGMGNSCSLDFSESFIARSLSSVFLLSEIFHLKRISFQKRPSHFCMRTRLGTINSRKKEASLFSRSPFGDKQPTID